MDRNELARLLDTVLESAKFEDYSPNGLQVEGQKDVRRVLTGVTASQALIDEAIRIGADTLVVHHGLFWRGESSRVTGYRKERLAALLRHEVNLFAYHLPLDAHSFLGNNAGWAAAMGWRALGRFGRQSLGFYGEQETPCTLAELAARLAKTLRQTPLVIAPKEETMMIRRLAWCSGGAQGLLEEALPLGVDAYLSGEISEQTTHIAKESGVAYFACGHHATERFGAQNLALWLARETGLKASFADFPNPA
ncbi:MAG: Nif3-like dinuclear metal center hexameric protein [Zoogloeaceae bacterium]|jgi:dinuclear metal center YbgI/SA1388 family protein|nr:Nif3-like dinuclear metal center hexameric protein [Zoogloeaceae bacterium]